LWREVTRSARPLDPARPDLLESTPETPPKKGNDSPPPTTTVERLPARTDPFAPQQLRLTRPGGSARSPSIAFDLVDRAVSPVGRPEAGLDRRNAERLRRGEREPDMRIDLHGMTSERAHRALDRCIGAALGSGARLVLVITGKGGKRRDPHEAPFMRGDQGVLRQQVPGWLSRGPHARQIVGVYQAHLRHGGAGALYLYLKKRR